MHSYTHVDVNSCRIPHFPKDKESYITIWGQPLVPFTAGQFSGHFIIQNFSHSWKSYQDPPVAVTELSQ